MILFLFLPRRSCPAYFHANELLIVVSMQIAVQQKFSPTIPGRQESDDALVWYLRFV